jgi:hypothetical protein
MPDDPTIDGEETEGDMIPLGEWLDIREKQARNATADLEAELADLLSD